MAFADDEARQAILDLRKEVRTLQEQLDMQKSAQMQLMTQINRLTEQNRMLTGRIEEISNSIHVEQRSSRELYTKLDDRLMALEPVSVEIDGATHLVDAQEKAAFDAAFAKLQEEDLKPALAALKDFVTRYPRSVYKAEALFWWGSTAFALEQYKTTMTVQNRLIRECPKSARVPDAMLSVGSAQAALGNVKAASATFSKVIRNHPDRKPPRSQEAARKHQGSQGKVIAKGFPSPIGRPKGRPICLSGGSTRVFARDDADGGGDTMHGTLETGV